MKCFVFLCVFMQTVGVWMVLCKDLLLDDNVE